MKLLTPISHLFNNENDAKSIIEVSDYLEARERTCKLKFEKTTKGVTGGNPVIENQHLRTTLTILNQKFCNQFIILLYSGNSYRTVYCRSIYEIFT